MANLTDYPSDSEVSERGLSLAIPCMVCLQDVQVYCHALFMFSLADLLELFVDLSPENPMQ